MKNSFYVFLHLFFLLFAFTSSAASILESSDIECESLSYDNESDDTCNAHIVNEGCQTIQVYQAINGDWVVVAQVPVGQSVSYNVHSYGTTLIFAYSFDEVLGSAQVECGRKYTINDDDCAQECQVFFTNSACQSVQVYVQNASDWALVGSISKGGTYSHYTVSGASYRFLYADGTSVATWTGVCGQTFTIHDSCPSTCPVYFTNRACEEVHVFLQLPNDWVFLGKVAVGSTSSYAAAQNGLTYVFKYASGSTLSTWQGWCSETHIVSDNCAQECDIFFDNDACEDVLAYQRVASDWVLIGTLNKGVKYRFASYSGVDFIFRYANGTEVGSWSAQCNATYTISDVCSVKCDAYVRNNACEKIFLFADGGSSSVGSVDVGATARVSAYEGTAFVVKYAGGSVVGNFDFRCDKTFLIQKTCPKPCDAYVSNKACDKIFLFKAGSSTAVGSVDVGSTVRVSAFEGTEFDVKYADGSAVGDFTFSCDKTFLIKKSCPKPCDAYVVNNACEEIFLFKVVDGATTSVGRIWIGSTARVSALAGTNFIVKYANGSSVGDFVFQCDKTFSISKSCSKPCDAYVRNSTCEEIFLFKTVDGKTTAVGSIGVGSLARVSALEGTAIVVKYADGSVVGNFDFVCNKTFSITKSCPQPCDAFITNNACQEIFLFKAGSSTALGRVWIGSTARVSALAGTNFVVKYADGSSVGDFVFQCDKTFSISKSCPQPCDAYVTNNACQEIFLFKDGSSSAAGSIDVGKTATVSALEGTAFVVKYADGTVVGNFDFLCDKTFIIRQTCTSPCDGVNVLAIKLYDQVTDMEVPGIGAIMDGGQIDGNLLPENYYITAEVTDATESVTLTVNGWRVCENIVPYTFPGAGDEGNNWNGGPGDHSVTVSLSSEADCYTNTCQTVSVSFSISEPTVMDPTCTLQASASQSAPDCNGNVILSGSVTGQSTCCEGSQEGLCGRLADYGGYVIDVEAVSGCPDGTGIRLWAAGSSDPTFVTVDLGEVVSAGNQVCATMLVKHCLNTDSTSASASLFTSLEKSNGFVTLGGAIFENTEFATFCFDLSNDTRFVKIVDNGQCSFRVDALQVTPFSCIGDSSVNYTWLNSVGDTISTSSSVAVNQIGDYTLAVQDCAGCLSVVEDINVVSLDAQGCFTPAEAGNLSLANGDTSIDVCIGDGISDAFDVVLTDAAGESSVWVILDPSRNIIAIQDNPPFEFERSTTAGLCIICHVSFNGELTGFEVGQNADNVGGDIDFSNEISVTKFTSGGPCGNGGLITNTESRSNSELKSLTVDTDEVLMYPNPVSNTLNLETNLELGSSIDVEIFTLDGRSIKRSPMVVSKTNQLNVSDLSSNQFYLIRIQQGDKGVLVDRFFKSE